MNLSFIKLIIELKKIEIWNPLFGMQYQDVNGFSVSNGLIIFFECFRLIIL